jgi:P4 family phage/plasmid primase-like protien
MTATSLATQDPASIIVIRNMRGALCSKAFEAAIDVPEGFRELKAEPGLLWTPAAVSIRDLAHLHRMLVAAAGLKDAAIIRGALSRDLDPDEERRGIYRRLVDGGFDNGLWLPAPRSFVALDLDGSTPPEEGWAGLSAALPAPFAGCSFVWNLTSSHRVKPGLRARLWFLLSAAVPDANLRRFAKSVPAWMKLDASLFTANHLHYVAAPEFRGGMEDPTGGEPRWGIFQGAHERVDATLLQALQSSEADPSSCGCILKNLPAPNPQEVADRVASCRLQKTSGARHDHGIGIACELISVGMAPEDIIPEVEDAIRRQGREPNRGEALGCIRHAVGRLNTGKLRVSKPPIASTIDRVEAAEAAAAEAAAAAPAGEPPGPVTSGEDIVVEAPRSLYGANDWLNAALYQQDCYPSQGFIRWGEQDWEWTGRHWQPLENDEVLLHRLQRHSGLKIQRARATVSSFRSLMGREFLSPPCTMKGDPLPNLLAFRNGVLNIDDWLFDTSGAALLPHDPSRFLTCSLPYDYVADAKCPRLLSFLMSVWANQPDQRREFQKMLGYLLMHDNRFHKMFILLGVKRSGKGTILDLIKNLVGSANFCSPNLSSLSADFGLHPLIGRSVALVDEMNQQGRISDVAVDRMKSISGGGSVPINRKGKGELHQKLPVRFVVACNRLPGFLDPSGALASRLCIFTMWESFFGREDRNLGAALEAELPGIAQFALAGLRMLLVEDGDFIAPNSSKNVAENYKAAQAPTTAFLDDCVEPGTPAEWMSMKDMYNIYRAWAEEHGHQATSASRLSIELGHRWPAEIEASKVRRAGVDGERDRQRSGFRLTAEGREYLKQVGVFPTT